MASARRDLADILDHITRTGGSLATGQQYVDRLRQQCRKLAALPGTFGRSRPELRPDIRSFAFGDYVIFFRYEGDTVEVVNILQGHRDIDAYFRDDSA